MSSPRTILATGARDWPDPHRVAETLDHTAEQADGAVRLLVGDTPGADTHARAWADRRGVAGPARNQALIDRLDQAKGERLVLAFHADLAHLSKGTRHCTDQARRR